MRSALVYPGNICHGQGCISYIYNIYISCFIYNTKFTIPFLYAHSSTCEFNPGCMKANQTLGICQTLRRGMTKVFTTNHHCRMILCYHRNRIGPTEIWWPPDAAGILQVQSSIFVVGLFQFSDFFAVQPSSSWTQKALYPEHCALHTATFQRSGPPA